MRDDVNCFLFDLKSFYTVIYLYSLYLTFDVHAIIVGVNINVRNLSKTM